jgi:hypothetical protein
MAGRPSDWRQLAAAEEALTDGGPGARTPDAMRRFLQLVRADAPMRPALAPSGLPLSRALAGITCDCGRTMPA